VFSAISLIFCFWKQLFRYLKLRENQALSLILINKINIFPLFIQTRRIKIDIVWIIFNIFKGLNQQILKLWFFKYFFVL